MENLMLILLLYIHSFPMYIHLRASFQVLTQGQKEQKGSDKYKPYDHSKFEDKKY